MSDLTEDLGRAAHGDRRAFARVYDSTSPCAYRLALCIAHDRELAQRLVVDSYCEAWRTAAENRTSGMSVRAWLMEIVHRRARASLTPDP
ncbi:MAG TPA: hypothetical protein VFG63_05160 [Nocardioidaceae bacterium]|nr:hypothetical protein [Nocardioidaceae bacterium]